MSALFQKKQRASVVKRPVLRQTPDPYDQISIKDSITIFWLRRNISSACSMRISDRQEIIYATLRQAERLTLVASTRNHRLIRELQPLPCTGDALSNVISGVAWDMPTRSAILDIAAHFGNEMSRDSGLVALKVLHGLMNSKVDVDFLHTVLTPAAFAALPELDRRIYFDKDVMGELLAVLASLLYGGEDRSPLPSEISKVLVVLRELLRVESHFEAKTVKIAALLPRIIPLLFSIGTNEAVQYGMEAFIILCKSPNRQVRVACARELVFMTRELHVWAGSELRSIFATFARDRDSNVRRLTAEAFVQVVEKLVTGRTDVTVRRAIRSFLQEENEIMLLRFVNSLPTILSTLCQSRGTPLQDGRIFAQLQYLLRRGPVLVGNELSKQMSLCETYFQAPKKRR